MKILVGFITCARIDEARKIGCTLLEKKLIACANIVPNIESIYWWKGKIEQSKEALLIVKTRNNLKAAVIKEIEKMHSYELPVIEFFETSMNAAAQKWIEKETGKK